MVASAIAGSVASMLSAVLVAYAILDIEHRVWSQWLYTVVYAFSGVVFGSSAGAEFLPDPVVRHWVVFLCFLTSGLSYKAPYLVLTASRPWRIAGLTALGTGLGSSLLLSALVIMRVFLETGGLQSQVKEDLALESGMLNAQQLFVLSMVALIEGGYFGLAIGMTEGGRSMRIIVLPHEAPHLVYPMAALVGAICGAAVERLRQHTDTAYVKGVELMVLGGKHNDDGELDPFLQAVDED